MHWVPVISNVLIFEHPLNRDSSFDELKLFETCLATHFHEPDR